MSEGSSPESSGCKPPRLRRVLPVILGAQFAGTSLWFAGNAVLPAMGYPEDVGLMTSAVQVGFIAGTALLALTGWADRWEARWVFFGSALFGAAANLGAVMPLSLPVLVGLRFLVGVSLAGVYPIGMKAAASYTRAGLGAALGLLVGALVLGTAIPHLLGGRLPWRWTLGAVSALAVAGGAAMLLWVPDGPYAKTGSLNRAAVRTLFRIPEFRSAAVGYWGHMWELYTFWAFLPSLLVLQGDLPVSEMSFAVIASGAIGCVAGGALALRWGSRRVAAVQLGISGTCCLVAPVAMGMPAPAFVAFLVLWGMTVAGDSPQYSALQAQAAPPELLGTGLAAVTSVGFGVTVLSLKITEGIGLPWGLGALALGPAVGLWGLRRRRTAQH